MRALVTLVSVMGVLIVLGVLTIAVTIFHRLSGPGSTAGAETLLEEPAGTRMAAIAAAGDRLAVVLSAIGQGGWPAWAGAMRKAQLPEKVCAACGRPFAWRRKWARDWEQVRYCSDACRRGRRPRADGAVSGTGLAKPAGSS